MVGNGAGLCGIETYSKVLVILFRKNRAIKALTYMHIKKELPH